MKLSHAHRALWLAAITAVCGSLSRGEDFEFGPQEAVILLKNGASLQGLVTPAGDRYIVSLGPSGQARVPTADVAAIFPDLEAAYQHRRRHLDGRLETQLELARWCLEQKLLARAADQLLAAEALYGSQPRLERLHQRLLLAAGSPSMASDSRPGETPESVHDPRADAAPLPPGAVEEFTAAVQPLLLNRCAATGCHGGRGDTDYVLVRPSFDLPITSRITHRNLAATARFIDRAAPERSSLLAKARTAHGGADAAPLLEREAAPQQLLAAWISLLASQRTARPEQIARRPEILYQATKQQPGADLPSPADEVDDQVSQGQDSPPPTSREEPAGDPFDPAIFNRRYHREAADRSGSEE